MYKVIAALFTLVAQILEKGCSRTAWHKQRRNCALYKENDLKFLAKKILRFERFHMLLYPFDLLRKKERSDPCRRKEGAKVPSRG